MIPVPRPLRLEANEELGAIVPRINDYARDVDGFLRGLPKFELRDLTFVGGATDVDIRTDVRPSCVMIGWIREEGGDPVGAVHSMSWEPATGGLRIKAIDGLTSATVYDLRLVVVGV